MCLVFSIYYDYTPQAFYGCVDDMFYDIVFLVTNGFCILIVSSCYDYDL
jgi:hypothetical protein